MEISKEERAALVTLSMRRLTLSEMGRVLDLDHTQVRRKLALLGLSAYKKPRTYEKKTGRELNEHLAGTEAYQVDTKQVSLRNTTAHDRKGLHIHLMAIVKKGTTTPIALGIAYQEVTAQDTARLLRYAPIPAGSTILADLGAEFMGDFQIEAQAKGLTLIRARGWINERHTKPDVERLFSNFASLRAVRIQVQAIAKLPLAKRFEAFPAIFKTFTEHLRNQGRYPTIIPQLQPIQTQI